MGRFTTSAIVLILFCLVLCLVLYFISRKVKRESFVSNDDEWQRKPVDVNSSHIFNIPNPTYFGKAPINVRRVIRPKYLYEIFDKVIQPTSIKGFVRTNVELKSQKSWQNLLDHTAFQMYQFYSPFNLPDSKIPAVNMIIAKVYKVVSSQFIIYKYGLTDIFVNPVTKKKQYGLFVVLVENFGFYGYFIYVRGYVSNKKAILSNFSIVGYMPTSKLARVVGTAATLDKDNINDSVYGKNVDWLTCRRLTKLVDDPQYTCFARYSDKVIPATNKFECESPLNYKGHQTEVGIWQKPCGYNTLRRKKMSGCFSMHTGELISSWGKLDCESSYGPFGREKTVGIWDSPCKKDTDCFFNKANTNYPNNYGGCINGYCELPKGLKRIGYRFFNPAFKANCYNCGGGKWFAMTELGSCCKSQHSSKSLTSPDYAFKGDLQKRQNYLRKSLRVPVISTDQYVKKFVRE